MKSWQTLATSMGVLLVAFVSGCAPAKMAVPPAVAKNSEVLEASDRSSWQGALVDESFKLGPYQVADVDRDWNSGSGFSIGPFADKKATTGYQYQLVGGGANLTGQCGSETKKGSWALSESSEVSWSSTTVACSCSGQGEPATLTWSAEDSEVAIGGKTYALEPIHETDKGGSTSEPVGFSVQGGEPLGAVEVTHPGRVWLNRALAPSVKAQASCLFVGLLLYTPPSTDD